MNLSGLDGLEMGMPGVAGNHYDQGARSFTGNLVFWARPNIIFASRPSGVCGPTPTATTCPALGVTASVGQFDDPDARTPGRGGLA